MYQIDDVYAVPDFPALPTDNIGSKGWFTGGNPATGQQATRVRSWWLNMIQSEFLGILFRAGMTEDKTNSLQITAALDKTYMPRGAAVGGAVASDYTPSSGQIYTNTMTLTPAAPGFIVATGIINLSGALIRTSNPQQQPVGCSHQLLIGGNGVAYASTVGSMSLQGIAPASAGATVQIVQQYATLANVTDPWVPVDQRLTYFFIPT